MKVLSFLLAVLFACGAYAGETLSMNSEKYLFSLAERIRNSERHIGFSGLTPKEQAFLLVWDLEAEVNNGGFDQFYFNSTGARAAATVDALKAIGALKMARIVERSNLLFGHVGPSTNREARQQQLLLLSEEAHEAMEELDESFYTYPDNLSELLAAYMKGTK